MRTATLAAALAVVLSATGLAALTAGRGVPHFAATPTRAHVALGPVTVLARPVAGADEAPVRLADAARARYGRVDGLAEVRTAPLPGADAALATAVAIRWD